MCMKNEQKKSVKGLSAKEKAELKEKARGIALEHIGVKPEEQKRVLDALKIAKMPIELTDKDIKMGEGEIDIRKLSPENLAQVTFRLMILNNLYLKDISTSFIDLLKLVMILLGKYGVDDITKAIEELEIKLRKDAESKIKEPNPKLN